MTLYDPSIVGLFAEKVLAFRHPAIDSSRTEIFPYSVNNNGALVSLGIILYDHNGELIVEDREIGQDYTMPGMLFVVDLNGELIIDNAYIKEEHAGQGIGTQLISSLMKTAEDSGFDGVRLIPDRRTGSELYWAKKHGFGPVDGSLRLEKRF